MAVIVSNGNTSLATPNGFVVSHAYNLAIGNSALPDLSTALLTSITFSSSGNCGGVIGAFINTAEVDRSIVMSLQKTWGTVTFDGTTDVVNASSHGKANGTIVVFSGGTMPTGLASNTTYYVVNTASNTFQLSLTLGGSAINFTGNGSGTITMWYDLASKTRTNAEIDPNYSVDGYIGNKYMYIDFPFSAAVAVTNAAATYRIRTYTIGGTKGSWYAAASETGTAATQTYCTYSDVTATPTSGVDCLIIKDRVYVDTSFAIYPVLSTGNTVLGIGMIICAQLITTLQEGVEPVTGLVWENSFTGQPTSSYILTIDGTIVLSQNSAFIIGSLSHRISYTKRAIVTCKISSSTGTATPTIATACRISTYTQAAFNHQFEFYGAIPTNQYCKILSQANTGQKVINIDRDVSTEWVSGDKIAIGGNIVQGVGEVSYYTIDTMTSSSITVTTNILSQNRRAGGFILNATNKYGIYFNTQIGRAHV